MTKIAVVGAGGTGYTLAADLTLTGFEVCLYEEPELGEKLGDVLRLGGIELTGAIGKGFARIANITTNIKEALYGADIIFVAVTALRHEKIAELCAPHIQDGQLIVIAPDNGGSLVFANIFKKSRVNHAVNIVGIASNYHSCRLIGPARVIVALPRRPKRMAAFPARETETARKKLSILQGVYDFVAGTNVLEIALSSSNIVIHLPGSLLNTGAIENSGGEYYLYSQGITPSVLRCIEATTAERKALFGALGYTIDSNNMLEKVSRSGEFPELNSFRNLIGPTSMQHRYIIEDATTGVALMISLADMVKVSVPVSKALMTIASIINRTDYLGEGRTVQKLGLAGMSIAELNQYLHSGDKQSIA